MKLTIRENGMANSVTLLGPNGGEIARVWKHERGKEYARLFAHAEGMRDFIRSIANDQIEIWSREAEELLREIERQ